MHGGTEWQSDDMNKQLNSICPHFHSFSVGFRTTPMDSTGVSHILEHTVLCGSKNYPVRDPFFKMISRSLSTFMNAFTGMWVCSTCTHACICTCIYMYKYNCGQCGVYQQIVSNSSIHVLITSCCYGSIDMICTNQLSYMILILLLW